MALRVDEETVVNQFVDPQIPVEVADDLVFPHRVVHDELVGRGGPDAAAAVRRERADRLREVEVVVETLELPARRVEFAEAPVGARPHIPLTVYVDGVDAVAYQAAGVVRAHLVLYEAVVALFVFEQPLLRGREPDVALCIHVEIADVAVVRVDDAADEPGLVAQVRDTAVGAVMRGDEAESAADVGHDVVVGVLLDVVDVFEREVLVRVLGAYETVARGIVVVDPVVGSQPQGAVAVADKPLGDAVRNPFVGHVTRVSCVASRAVVPQDAFVRGEPQAVVGGSEQVVDDDFAFGPFPVVGQADAVDLLAFEVEFGQSAVGADPDDVLPVAEKRAQRVVGQRRRVGQRTVIGAGPTAAGVVEREPVGRCEQQVRIVVAEDALYVVVRKSAVFRAEGAERLLGMPDVEDDQAAGTSDVQQVGGVLRDIQRVDQVVVGVVGQLPAPGFIADETVVRGVEAVEPVEGAEPQHPVPVGADAADFVGHPVECIGYQYEIVDIAFPQVEADQPFERPDPHHPLRIVVDAADAQVVEQPQRVVVRMVFHETFRHGVVEVEPLLGADPQFARACEVYAVDERGADRRRIPGVVAERFEIVAVVAVEPFGRPEPHQPRTVLCHGENHFVRQSRVDREVGEMEVRDLSPQGQPAKQQQSGSKVFHRS